MEQHTRILICKHCGKEFVQKNRLQKFCSHQCKVLNERQTKKTKPKEKKCAVCGASFKPYTSIDKYCSHLCRIENGKKNRTKRWSAESCAKITGTGNPAYRNGFFTRATKKTNDGSRLFNKNARQIKQDMINSDGFIYCQFCNANSARKYETHHLVFRSEKPNHPSIHEKINLLVVCIKCHNELHKKKGLRNEIIEKRGLAAVFGEDVRNK